MFTSPGNGGPGKLQGEFRPVESIMRCEDFKSNFARRLSTRYSSSPSAPASQKQDLALTLCPSEKKAAENMSDYVSKRTEPCSLLLSNSHTEQVGDVVPPDNKDKAPMKTSDLRNTKVTALNMEVETLRWQLAQTEANRQMHISLLKQLVTFLSRVKEHIELQSADAAGLKRETSSSRSPARPANLVDLPRSRSVVHVNKTTEYSVALPKKMSTRKISKSISNVHGYSPTLRSPSKLSLAPNSEKALKIIEEISRMTKLAGTILSTKLPDLASMYTDNHNNESNMTKPLNIQNEKEDRSDSTSLINISASCDIFNNAVMESEMKEKSLTNLIERPSMLSLDLKDDHESAQLGDIESDQTSVSSKSNSNAPTYRISKIAPDKRNDYGSCNFIEDESGFSSMNSFQDIGIPIISIIPPSPCKEMSYTRMEEVSLIMNDSEKLLDKQAVKVFWV